MRVSLTGLKGFDSQMKAVGKKLGINVGLVRDKIGIEIAKKTILRTPRDTGRLAASWNLAYGDPDKSVVAKGNYAKPTIVGKFNPNPFIALFFTNALPYAVPIESGWSKTKAPQGMLGVSIEEVRAQVGVFLRTI